MISGLVSFIVLNWNGKEVVCDCLESLLTQTYLSHEIIVVDNASVDGSREMLRERYAGRIQLIENKENLGFAGGCNTGIRAARGEWIALVNSDAAINPDWARAMVAGIQFSEKIGMAACKIFFWEKPGTIENAGHVLSRDGFGRLRGRLEIDQGQYDKRRAVFSPSGCAALYRRTMLDEIGFFDESFFAYADDVDLALRGRLAGYGCHYVPSAIARHRLSASFGILSPQKVYLSERNRVWLVIKNFPLSHLWQAPFYTALRYFYHLVGVFQKKGPAAQYAEQTSFLSLFVITLRVYLSTLVNLPRLFRSRRLVFKKSRLKPRQFEFWMKRYGISARDAALNELT